VPKQKVSIQSDINRGTGVPRVITAGTAVPRKDPPLLRPLCIVRTSVLLESFGASDECFDCFATSLQDSVCIDTPHRRGQFVLPARAVEPRRCMGDESPITQEPACSLRYGRAVLW